MNFRHVVSPTLRLLIVAADSALMTLAELENWLDDLDTQSVD